MTQVPMRNQGLGNYHWGPGGIEKEGDYAFRSQRVYPASDPKRTGDVYETKIEVAMFCPKYGICYFDVTTGDPVHPVWKWNGDMSAPLTITPSIGCDNAPRCGRHMTISNGVMHRTP